MDGLEKHTNSMAHAGIDILFGKVKYDVFKTTPINK